MATELTVLGWSVVLLFVQIILQASLTAKDNGSAYSAGNHEQAPTLSPVVNSWNAVLRWRGYWGGYGWVGSPRSG